VVCPRPESLIPESPQSCSMIPVVEHSSLLTILYLPVMFAQCAGAVV
jgi:hypothetical protein